MKNLTSEQKLKYVQDFRGLIKLEEISSQIFILKNEKVSIGLISKVILGKRTDHYSIIDTCYNSIIKKLDGLMPNNQ